MTPTREAVIARLRGALVATPFVLAAWLEGADADGRADAFSDIDLWLDVERDAVEAAFEVVRGVVAAFGPLDVAQATEHPDPEIRQRFYRSAGLPPFWFVDTCVQLHGRDVVLGPQDAAHVLFDRSGVIRRGSSNVIDVQQAVSALLGRRWRWVLVDKEVRRGHPLEALAYYHAEVLEALVELLRLRHCPEKLGYGLKHVHADLPGPVTARLEALYGLTRLDELPLGVAQAAGWFDAVAGELRPDPPH